MFFGKPQDFSTRAKTRRSLEMTLIPGYGIWGSALAQRRANLGYPNRAKSHIR